MILELQQLKRKLDGLVWWALFFGTMLIVLLTFLVAGPQLESKLFPVKSNFVVTSAVRQDGNLIISGTHRKERACQFIPGMIARTETGGLLYVETLSGTKNINWPVTEGDALPHRFGPWKIHYGAGQKLELYQHFRCHPLWITTEHIGNIDDTD